MLQCVDIRVSLRDALRERAIALGQRIDGIGDLLFGEATHLGHHAREVLQIGVEGLGRVQIGHCFCPSVADWLISVSRSDPLYNPAYGGR